MSRKSRARHLARVGQPPAPRTALEAPASPTPPAPDLGACLHCLRTLEESFQYLGGEVVRLYLDLRDEHDMDHAEAMEELNGYMAALASAGERYHELEVLFYRTDVDAGEAPDPFTDEETRLFNAWFDLKAQWTAERCQVPADD